MKKSNKITFSAIMAALAAVAMLLSYFPYLTYSVPALAGLFIMVTVIELDLKWAFASYLTAAVITFFAAEPESKLLFVLFFGYYPILKAAAEKIGKAAIEWVIKLTVFNAAVLAVYVLLAKPFGISVEEFGEWGKYGAYLMLALGNVVFVVYDIAISRVAAAYIRTLHPRIKKTFRY